MTNFSHLFDWMNAIKYNFIKNLNNLEYSYWKKDSLFWKSAEFRTILHVCGWLPIFFIIIEPAAAHEYYIPFLWQWET